MQVLEVKFAIICSWHREVFFDGSAFVHGNFVKLEFCFKDNAHGTITFSIHLPTCATSYIFVTVPNFATRSLWLCLRHSVYRCMHCCGSVTAQ